MSKCVFCDLMGSDTIEAYASGVAMFTPLNPVVPGHKLFVHEQHTEDAAHDPNITGVVFREAAFYAKGNKQAFNLITSRGTEATQSVYHLHVHYVPRAKADGLQLPWSNQANTKPEGVN